MSNQKLMGYFDFDESKLHANRNRRLTADQLELLQADDRSTNRLSLNVGIALIAGSIVFTFLFFQWGIFSPDASLFGLAGCLAPILIGVFAIKIGIKKSTFTLTKAEGRVNIVEEKSYSPTLHREDSKCVMQIGEATFEIESEAGGFIMQGDTYAVYYIHETDRIMSLEKIS